MQWEAPAEPGARYEMLRPVDLVDEVQPAVRRGHAQRHRLAQRLAQLAESRPGELAEQRAHVRFACEPDQLWAEENAIRLGDSQEKPLPLHRLDEAKGRGAREPGGACERRDARA